MDKNMKMIALCSAYQALCNNPIPTDNERQWREAIAGRIDDLTMTIISTEEPDTLKPNTQRKPIDTQDEIPF